MPHLIICQQRSERIGQGKTCAPCSDAALGNLRSWLLVEDVQVESLVPESEGHCVSQRVLAPSLASQWGEVASDCSKCRVAGGGRRVGSTGGVGGWCRQCWAPLSCTDGIVQQTLPSSGRSRNDDLVVSPAPVFWSGAIGFLLGLGGFLYLINALKIKAPEVRSQC